MSIYPVISIELQHAGLPGFATLIRTVTLLPMVRRGLALMILWGGTWGGLLLGGTAMLSGCESHLFPKDAQYTPYDRYMTLHGKARPEQKTSQLNPDRPALRQRLKPLDEP